ncbi:MAG: lasso peptide biosynthesis B2 protein [Actinomycetia bacterium]|nr:lasso peptide biosynthesis B2 protein [bacterium]MCP4083905.1 lasso peptide biosynthesis B2 protein [Actinomycetes bacterium]
MSSLPPWRKQARNLLARPLREQILIAQTFVLLGASRLAIRALTFRRLERFLGERMVESPEELSPAQIQAARTVRWAIGRVSGRTPWVSNCFPQAIAARVLLRRRKVPCTIYLGAGFVSERAEGDNSASAASLTTMVAHAWVRSGPLFVTGGDGTLKYGAVASFS